MVLFFLCPQKRAKRKRKAREYLVYETPYRIGYTGNKVLIEFILNHASELQILRHKMIQEHELKKEVFDRWQI